MENGKSGILYPNNEPHTLAFEIMKLNDDKNLLKKMSENEIEFATKRHDPKVVFGYLQAIYMDIIRKVKTLEEDLES